MIDREIQYVDPDELARKRNNQGAGVAGATQSAPLRDFPKLAPEAFYGPAGEIVCTIEPHTESDPALLLLTCHAYFGNAIGRGPHYKVEGATHRPILNILFVGDTSKGRKGTGDGRIREVFAIADQFWCRYCIKSGLSSGEGLIDEVRDQREKLVKGEMQVIDEGVADKRLLIMQPEFGGALQVMRREGSILSAVLRDAWDGRDLATLVRHSPVRATAPHISVIGHITRAELCNLLDQISIANGLGNRFLFGCVQRKRVLPFGGALSSETLGKLGTIVFDSSARAREIDRMQWADCGREGWAAIYEQLSEGKPGLVGALMARAEAQVLRLALTYALWDGSELITLDHLTAAMAVWVYCEASIHYIFGDSLGDPVADAILAALKRAYPDALTRTEISYLFSRNESAGRIARTLEELARLGLAMMQGVSPNGAGRPPEAWAYTPVRDRS
jgi:hypothetical protein